MKPHVHILPLASVIVALQVFLVLMALKLLAIRFRGHGLAQAILTTL